MLAATLVVRVAAVPGFSGWLMPGRRAPGGGGRSRVNGREAGHGGHPGRKVAHGPCLWWAALPGGSGERGCDGPRLPGWGPGWGLGLGGAGAPTAAGPPRARGCSESRPAPCVPADPGPDLRDDHVLPGGEGRHLLRVGCPPPATLLRCQRMLPCRDGLEDSPPAWARGAGRAGSRGPEDPRPGLSAGLEEEAECGPPARPGGFWRFSLATSMCSPEQCLPPDPRPGQGAGVRGLLLVLVLKVGLQPRHPHSAWGPGRLLRTLIKRGQQPTPHLPTCVCCCPDPHGVPRLGKPHVTVDPPPPLPTRVWCLGWGSGHRPERATWPGRWGSCPSKEPQNCCEIGSQGTVALSLLTGPQPVNKCHSVPAPDARWPPHPGVSFSYLFRFIPGNRPYFSIMRAVGGRVGITGPGTRAVVQLRPEHQAGAGPPANTDGA